MKLPLSEKEVFKLPVFPEYERIDKPKEIIFRSAVWIHLDRDWKVDVFKVPVINWFRPITDCSEKERLQHLQQCLNRHLEQCLLVSKYMRRDERYLVDNHVFFDTILKADIDAFELKLFTLYP